MYDFSELREATDALWAAISARLVALGVPAPPELTRDRDLERMWTDPALLLGQTCGYPLMTSLAGKVSVLATPCYGAAGCEGAFYRSAVIVRQGDPAAVLADLRGRTCAVNDAASNSGMNVFRAAVAKVAGAERFFDAVVMTGAHEASLRAVASGLADVAAIDCVTWALMQRVRPDAVRGLRVLGWTQASPGLPLITSLRTDAAIRAALLRVLSQVEEDRALAPVRAALLLERFEVLEAGAYGAVLEMERQAHASGYGEVR